MQRTINVSFASSKFPLQSRQIAIPQDAESLPSKYTPAVQNELTDLDTTIKQLDFDAKERSRIFQARLDEIWSDVHNFEAQLKSEIVASAESIDAIRLDYQSHIDNFQENFLKEINQIFDRYDQELIPPMHQHLDSINKDIDQFFHQKAPLSIQQQAGEVNRHLRRMFEMFNIEQQRQIKRDLKLVKRVNKYFQSTEQRLEDERALQASCCYNLEDIISELQRPAARLFLMRVNQSIHSIVSLRDTHKLEVQKRLSEDLDVLDTIVETQELLKQIILLHFSIELDDHETEVVAEQIRERIKFPKLTMRLMKTIRKANDKDLHEMEVVQESSIAPPVELVIEKKPTKGKKVTK